MREIKENGTKVIVRKRRMGKSTELYGMCLEVLMSNTRNIAFLSKNHAQARTSFNGFLEYVNIFTKGKMMHLFEQDVTAKTIRYERYKIRFITPQNILKDEDFKVFDNIDLMDDNMDVVTLSGTSI